MLMAHIRFFAQHVTLCYACHFCEVGIAAVQARVDVSPSFLSVSLWPKLFIIVQNSDKLLPGYTCGMCLLGLPVGDSVAPCRQKLRSSYRYP